MKTDLKDYQDYLDAQWEFAARKRPEDKLDELGYTIDKCNLDFWGDYHLWYHCWLCGGDKMDKDHQKHWWEFWKSGHKQLIESID